MTNGAFLGRIGRVDVYHWNSSDRCLVLDELPELIESPAMLFASLSLRNRRPLPDTLKIFEGDHGRGVFGFRNQFFGDAVVHVPTKPSLSTREFLEMTFGAIGPTALKIGLEVIYLGSNVLDTVTGELFAGRINGNVLDPEIDADNANRFDLGRLGNFNDDAEIELTPFENEVGLSSDPIEPGFVVLADDNRDLYPAFDSQERNEIETFPGHESLIVDDRSVKIEGRFDRFISLVGFAGLRDSSDRHLSGKVKLFPNRIIDDLLQLDFIGGTKLKRSVSHEVAGGVKLMHRLANSLNLFWGRFKFDLERLHHVYIHIPSMEMNLSVPRRSESRRAFLPRLKSGASC
jgi:hypothetical protein